MGPLLPEDVVRQEKAEKMQDFRTTLQELQIVEHNPQVHVQPAASRVLAPPPQPPLYPGGLDALVGAKSPQEMLDRQLLKPCE